MEDDRLTPVTVDYFTSLSKKQQSAYRASDAAGEIVLAASSYGGLQTSTARLRRALAMAAQGNDSGELHAVEGAARELARGVCEALKVSVPEVRVHEVRPRGAYGELHGLTTRWTHRQGTGEDKTRIEVWMKTSVGESVVAWKTFLRTLCHELVHHLDYALLKLEDSLHTEGFFRRESGLVRQLEMWPSESRARLHRKHAREAAPASETKEGKLERLRKRLQRETAPARSEASARPKRKATETSASRNDVRASHGVVSADEATLAVAGAPPAMTEAPPAMADAPLAATQASRPPEDQTGLVHSESADSETAALAPLEETPPSQEAPPSRRMIDKRSRRRKKPTAQTELTWGMDVRENEAQNDVSV